MDRLFRELRAVRAVAPTVILVDIGTNHLDSGCVPEDLTGYCSIRTRTAYNTLCVPGSSMRDIDPPTSRLGVLNSDLILIVPARLSKIKFLH